MESSPYSRLEELRPRLVCGSGPSLARFIAGCDFTVEGEFIVSRFKSD
jgi:hypothetical protein